jgi:two-component system chemotaxis sensor kinase CheA
VLLDVICSPGFSTRDEADRASGRGVGMAVVRDTVQELGGTASRQSAQHHLRANCPDVGRCADRSRRHRTFAPRWVVREIAEVDAGSLRGFSENNELMTHRGMTVPVGLARLLPEQTPRQRMHVTLIGTARRRSGSRSIASRSAKSW